MGPALSGGQMKGLEVLGGLQVVFRGTLGVSSQAKQVATPQEKANLELGATMLPLLRTAPGRLGTGNIVGLPALVSFA